MNINLFTALFVVTLASSNALSQAMPAPESKPRTDLESFQEKYGSVIVQGYSRQPEIRGSSGGTFQIIVKEYLDASTKVKVKGLIVEVDSGERYSSSARSFIEYGEIDSLIKGINFISKIDKTSTSLDLFEATYKTKDDFSVTVFSRTAGTIAAAVIVGRIGRKIVYLNLTQLPDLVTQLQGAKTTLDAL